MQAALYNLTKLAKGVLHLHKLSLRLQTVLALLQRTDCLADIGSDHAFLVATAVLQGKAKSGVAVEIHFQPWQQSQRTVRALELHGAVDVRLGDGLEPLAADEVQALCIAGMGGGTIRGILKCGHDKLSQVSQMVLQPNVDAAILRSYLCETGYSITDEAVIEEAAVFYQVMRAEKGSESTDFSPLELEYGRINLKRREPQTMRLLTRDLAHWERVHISLSAGQHDGATQRRQWVGGRILALEEALARGC